MESFDEMGLKEEILRGIYAYGFTEPSKIQQKGILPVVQGRDTIAQVNKIIIALSNFLLFIGLTLQIAKSHLSIAPAFNSN